MINTCTYVELYRMGEIGTGSSEFLTQSMPHVIQKVHVQVYGSQEASTMSTQLDRMYM